MLKWRQTSCLFFPPPTLCGFALASSFALLFFFRVHFQRCSFYMRKYSHKGHRHLPPSTFQHEPYAFAAAQSNTSTTANDVVATLSSPFFHPPKRARWLEEGPLADVASTSPPAHIEDTPGKHVTSSIEPFAESPPVTMATSFVDSFSFAVNPLLSINCYSHFFFLYQQCPCAPLHQHANATSPTIFSL